MKSCGFLWIFYSFLFLILTLSNMCSGTVNLNNLNFLWFNVEQVRVVLKWKFISSCPCVMLYMEVFSDIRRWCFQCPYAKLLIFYSDCMNSLYISKKKQVIKVDVYFCPGFKILYASTLLYFNNPSLDIFLCCCLDTIFCTPVLSQDLYSVFKQGY